MQIIRKRISLENFKNRFPKSFGTEWGKVVTHDYTIDTDSVLYNVRDRLPLVYDSPFNSAHTEDNVSRLRFGNMIRLNTWLDNVIEKSSFVKFCVRNNKPMWINYDIESEDDDFNVIDIVEEIPFITDSGNTAYTEGIVWVTDDAEKLKETFYVEGDDGMNGVCSRITAFSDFFDQARNEIFSSGLTKVDEAYFDVNLMLTESINNMGAYTESGTTRYETNNGSATTIMTESCLNQVMRHKKSYDDSGNELPFIIESGVSDNSYGLGLIFDENDNVISGLSINPGYITGVSYNVYINDNGIVCGDYVEEVTTGSGIILFTYVIGAEITTGNTYQGGVTYSEEYCLGEDEELLFNYEGQRLKALFKRILYGKQPDEYKKYKNYQSGKRYALVTFDSQYKVESANSIFFKEECLIGIDDIKKDSNKPRVERGTSAAFEIHNILGECHSMDDLAKYRNDFFTIKDDEKQ